MKTLEYPLCATTLTRQECNRLVKSIHDAAFPKAHLCRTIPHDIRYGSKDALGLGLDDLYISQGLDKIIFFMEEINGKSMSRPLLRANFEWAMIHVGIGEKSLFDINYNDFGHLLPRTWIKSLWEFVHIYKVKMPTYDFLLKQRRDGDLFLMESFHQTGFSKKQLIKLNRCRLYLQVELLSDITDGTGDRIHPSAYQGHRQHNSQSIHDWPEQHNPDKHHWKLWRKALRDSFPRINAQRLGRLQTPLGSWIDGNRDKWRWFFSPATSSLYCRTHNYPEWKVYKPRRTHGAVTRMNAFQYSQSSNNLPLDAMRATIIQDQQNHNRVRITGWAHEHFIDQPTQQQKEEEKKVWMVNNVYNQQEEQWIVEQLRQNIPLMIVSDGSYHPQHKVGTSAWVIASTSDTSRRIQGDNIVPGQAHVQCPHRSELTGLVGAVRHIEQLCQQYNINQGQVEIACDGLEAYKIATRYKWKHITNMGHFDIASCLHQLLQHSTITWKFRHVYGHQDESTNIQDIDIWGQLNMVADTYAKIALWRHIAETGPTVQMNQLHQAIPSITTSYSGQEISIVSNLKNWLKHHFAQTRILDYW